MMRTICSLALLAAISPAQTLFLADGLQRRLSTVDPGNGTVSFARSLDPVGLPQGLATEGTSLFLLDGGTSGPPLLAERALWAVSLPNGAPAFVASPPASLPFLFWEDLAWEAATGSFLAISNGIFLGNAVYRFNLGGSVTQLASYPIAAGPLSLAISPAGTVWVTTLFPSLPDTTLGTLDLQTGAITPVAQLAINAYAPMSFHPANGLLYIADPSTQTLLSFDPATSLLATIAPLFDPMVPSIAPTGLCWATPVLSGASLSSVGAGCAGSQGVPALASVGGAVPQLGLPSFALRVAQTPPSASSLWFVADHAQADALAVAPGCMIHLDVPSLFAYLNAGANPFTTLVSDPGGTAILPVPLPPNPFLSGMRIGVQVLVIDPQTTRGYSLTNALDLVLGS